MLTASLQTPILVFTLQCADLHFVYICFPMRSCEGVICPRPLASQSLSETLYQNNCSTFDAVLRWILCNKPAKFDAKLVNMPPMTRVERCWSSNIRPPTKVVDRLEISQMFFSSASQNLSSCIVGTVQSQPTELKRRGDKSFFLFVT